MNNIINAQYLIHSLWEQLLGNHQAVKSNLKWPDDRDIGLLFVIRINGDNFESGKDHRQVHHQVNIVVTKGHRCYTSLERVSPFDLPEASRFRNTSNHDTGWYTDGLSIITNTLFDMNRYINGPRVERGEQAKPLKDLDPYAQFGYGLTMPKPVQFVRVTRVPFGDNDYFDRLSNIELLDFTINVNKEPS